MVFLGSNSGCWPHLVESRYGPQVERMGPYAANFSSSAFALFRSSVSKPSVNQP